MFGKRIQDKYEKYRMHYANIVIASCGIIMKHALNRTKNNSALKCAQNTVFYTNLSRTS